MSDPLVELEKRLIAGYQAQLQCYERALQIMEQSPQDAGTGLGTDPWIQRLNALLNEATALEAAMTEDRTVWRFSGRRPGSELNELLHRLAVSMRRLTGCIDTRMAQLQTRKQSLLPEMDAFIQGRRMLHAYGKSR